MKLKSSYLKFRTIMPRLKALLFAKRECSKAQWSYFCRYCKARRMSWAEALDLFDTEKA